jgi:DNA mismatch repair protein MutS2
MNLQEKSLRTIELPIILDMLAAEAVSETAKEAALALSLSCDANIVKARLEETSAAKDMMTLKSAPPFSGVQDVRLIVKRADIGGMLNTIELMRVASLLRAAAASIAYAKNDREQAPTAIDYLFNALRGNKFLESKISDAIVGEDEISDNASSELASIRRHIRIAGDKVRQTLNKIITSPTYAKALQEPIITLKNNRFVVPVKAEQKAAIPGLVHDISSSGATLFVEPMAAVNINNDIRELNSKEKIEIERILMELSADVAAHSDNITSDFEVLSQLDLIFAKAKLSYKMNAVQPNLSEDMSINLNKARHPLLAPKEAVPIDIRLGGEFDTVVITGPNTGGKTVALKTLGLLCAMAQCGLHIPANDLSHVPVFEYILADIGDEQSIEQSLSTFSSHMRNIVEMLANCEGDALLLFDELGAGTDPVEGAALAISIIEHARKNSGSRIAATTHYAELKTYALTSVGVANASCEFDVETLRPTYKLITGIPGKSNAFAISRRLGLPENIIEDAIGRVSLKDAAFEDAVMNLEASRAALEDERLEAKRLLRDAETDRQKAEEYRDVIESERAKAAQVAKKEAEQILKDARDTAESIMDELKEMRKKAVSSTDWQKLNEEKADLFRRLNEAEDSVRTTITEIPKKASREIVAGDRVRLLGLGTMADVISISHDGTLFLQAGIMKVTVRQSEVELVEESQQPDVKKQIAKSNAELRQMTAKPEINLLGMTIDDAIPTLENFIDNARMAKLNSVRVIHGKGTGALRRAVHERLRKEKGIKSFRLGKFGEGEDGVTVVEF